MLKTKKWLRENGILLLWAAVIGTAVLFVFSTALAAEPDATIHRNHIIRLHVLAHDDSPEEQELKLVMRDSIWAVIQDLTAAATSLGDARAAIEANLPLIQQTAQQIADMHTHSATPHYITARFLDELEFPVTSYGALILPQGRYSALQVIIGNGGGGNWWCVMFPPMCLMQIGRGQVHEAEAEAETSSQTTLRPRLRMLDFFRTR